MKSKSYPDWGTRELQNCQQERRTARSLGYENADDYRKGLGVVKRLLAEKGTEEEMHTCHAIACNVPVPSEMLMCKSHWFRVPLALRNKVWAEYRKGITRAYCATAKDAVTAVALAEGRTVTGQEKELLLYDMVQTED